MHGVFERNVREAREIERTLVQGNARLCSPIFGRVCKIIWPHKTAEQLAAAVGCSVRAAAYEISGEREPTARTLAIVMVEITKKRV
jgi:hypothetical protein